MAQDKELAELAYELAFLILTPTLYPGDVEKAKTQVAEAIMKHLNAIMVIREPKGIGKAEKGGKQ